MNDLLSGQSYQSAMANMKEIDAVLDMINVDISDVRFVCIVI